MTNTKNYFNKHFETYREILTTLNSTARNTVVHCSIFRDVFKPPKTRAEYKLFWHSKGHMLPKPVFYWQNTATVKLSDRQRDRNFKQVSEGDIYIYIYIHTLYIYTYIRMAEEKACNSFTCQLLLKWKVKKM